MVAKLLALEGPLKGIVLSLEKREEWILGRDSEQSHIVIEDPSVDRRQLLVRKDGDAYSLENLSDSNPIYFNDELLKQPVMLAHKDKLKVGNTLFEFQLDQEKKSQEDEDEDQQPEEEMQLEELEEAPIEGLSDENSAELPPSEPEEPAEEPAELPLSEQQELIQPPESASEENEGIEVSSKESPETKEEGSQAIEESSSEEPLEEFRLEEKDELEEEKEFALENQESDRPEEESREQIEIDERDFEERAQTQEEPEHDEPIFNIPEEDETPDIDLTPSVRFVLKVITGPNSGGEFVLHEGKDFLIGTDTTSCDIVLHDLSVSREHARLILSSSGELEIQDLKSRNGVLIDQQPVEEKASFSPNSIITLGTTSFFILDREAPQETIIAPSFEPVGSQPAAPQGTEEGTVQEIPAETEKKKEEQAKKKEEERVLVKTKAQEGTKIFTAIATGLAIVIVLGILSLWNVKEIAPTPTDYLVEIQEALQDFPGVKYTYSKVTRKLFLLGHVSTGVEKNELLYNLSSLAFIRGIEDNIVNDEAIWQEMNILLSKDETFKGVSMHSPRPGVFVLQGYLKKEEQAAMLNDYMNIHFNFLDLLENRVIVEEQVHNQIVSNLMQEGFGSVAVTFLNGDLILAGYVGANQEKKFLSLLQEFNMIPGVRHVQNFVVVVSPEQEVIDLNIRFPGKYRVTGFSKHGDVNINVVVNGQILARGDTLDGMTITSLQPHAIFLERDGLKYKLEYNK